ncbi:hypothetical protein M5U04_21300 [Xenorhabdus sp. XENO-1]|uniref:hypothetical protein n=1 Tax=Xenorhabdus bovienii TaxID=40576 RepID=UPI0020CA9582|nr:hypothetical protein [Xenorhabdus bovienii]MCP9270531.1 hypothetical protein [Xenorhabdus bovienii subsp. africana]
MKEPILASIKFDTSELDKKIDELKAVFLEGIPEAVLDEISDLFSNVILANCSTTRRAFGAVDVIYFLDIDAGAYNEILATVRALKANLTHKYNCPLYGKSPEEILEHFKKYNFVDDHGHRLEMCQDFIDLISITTNKE